MNLPFQLSDAFAMIFAIDHYAYLLFAMAFDHFVQRFHNDSIDEQAILEVVHVSARVDFHLALFEYQLHLQVLCHFEFWLLNPFNKRKDL